MNILDIAIIAFCIMESANVYILYFAPDFPYGNGITVFNAWHKSKDNIKDNLFAKYMCNWVAGVKLIFIFLLIVIVLKGNDTTKIFAVLAMILSIASYYVGLHPIIKKLDELGEITPKGYSKTLFMMITGFMLMFTGSLIYYLLTN